MEAIGNQDGGNQDGGDQDGSNQDGGNRDGGKREVGNKREANKMEANKEEANKQEETKEETVWPDLSQIKCRNENHHPSCVGAHPSCDLARWFNWHIRKDKDAKEEFERCGKKYRYS